MEPSNQSQAAARSTGCWASTLYYRFVGWVYGRPAHFGFVPARPWSVTPARPAAAVIRCCSQSGIDRNLPRASTLDRHDHASLYRRNIRPAMQWSLPGYHHRLCHDSANDSNGSSLAWTVLRQAIHGIAGGARRRQTADAAIQLSTRAHGTDLKPHVVCQLLAFAMGWACAG